MKFQLRGNELHKVLGKVIKGFNPKEDNSYVAFKLDPEENKLTATSRSRATFFKGDIEAFSVEVASGEPLVYHLDGMKLKQLISILPSSPVPVTFEINDKLRSFEIKSAGDLFKLPVLSETPLAPAPEVKELVTVDANEFMKTAKDLIRIVSTEQSAQEHQISCMHLNINDKKLKISATDSYALGSVTVDTSPVTMKDGEVKDVLIRHTEVSTLMETFSQGEVLTIVGSTDMFGYIDEEGTVSLVGVINIPPLDTRQIEAVTKKDNCITVDKAEFKYAIETVAKLSPSDETVDVELAKDLDHVKISNRYGDSIQVTVSKSELSSPGIASFATNVILKSITPANNGSIRLEFGPLTEGQASAVRVVSLQADGSNVEGTSLIATMMVR